MRRAKSDEENEISVFRKDRTLYFFEEINNQTVCKAIRYLDEMEKESKTKEIDIILCTDGGLVYDGLALYDRIRTSACQINMTGVGMIASMGIIVYLAGDTRYSNENTRFMTHQCWDSIEGRTTDVKIGAKELEIIENICTEIISQRTKQTPREVSNDIKLGDKYYGTEEAKEKGYVHEIIKNPRARRRRKTKK